MTKLHLRPATEADAQLLWQWANDPETRRMSFSSDLIPWESHLRWMEERLHDPNTRLYLALDEHDKSVAQVRFDLQGSRAVVSLSVAPGERGKGYSTEVVRLGVQKLLAASAIQVVDAYIKPGNPISVRAFIRAGFSPAPECCVAGTPAIHMEWNLTSGT